MFNLKLLGGALGARLCSYVLSSRAPRKATKLKVQGPAVDEVVVIAQKLNEARNGIQTQTGASTYTINEAAIDAAARRRQSIAQPSDHAGARMWPRTRSDNSMCAANTTAFNIA